MRVYPPFKFVLFLLSLILMSFIIRTLSKYSSKTATTHADISNKKVKPFLTYLDIIEKRHKLCIEREPFNYSGVKKRECPKNNIVTGYQGGRLGNQIWEYFAIWMVANKTGLEPFVPSCLKRRLSIFLDDLTLPVLEEIHDCPAEKRVVVAFPKSPWTYDHNLIIPNYITTPLLLAEKITEIYEVFKIKRSFLDKSQEILKYGVKFVDSPINTFIGVHVRRTDYIPRLKNFYNQVATDIVVFFISAMKYYEKKYPNPIFILVSDEPDWCWEQFKFKKNVYVTAKYHESSPELDLALMASCNHTIMDYGTFGEWGGIFAGGETVFYKIHSWGYSTYYISKHLKYWHTLDKSDFIDISDNTTSLLPVS